MAFIVGEAGVDGDEVDVLLPPVVAGLQLHQTAHRSGVDLESTFRALRMFGRLTRVTTLSLSSETSAGISAKSHAM